MGSNGSVMNRADKQNLRERYGYCLECEGVPVLLFNIKKSRINPLWITREPRKEENECADGVCYRCHPDKNPNQRRRNRPGGRRSVGSNGGNAAPNRNRASMPVISAMQQARTEMQAHMAPGAASARNFGHTSDSSLPSVRGGGPSVLPKAPVTPVHTPDVIDAAVTPVLMTPSMAVPVFSSPQPVHAPAPPPQPSPVPAPVPAPVPPNQQTPFNHQPQNHVAPPPSAWNFQGQTSPPSHRRRHVRHTSSAPYVPPYTGNVNENQPGAESMSSIGETDASEDMQGSHADSNHLVSIPDMGYCPSREPEPHMSDYYRPGRRPSSGSYSSTSVTSASNHSGFDQPGPPLRYHDQRDPSPLQPMQSDPPPQRSCPSPLAAAPQAPKLAPAPSPIPAPSPAPAPTPPAAAPMPTVSEREIDSIIDGVDSFVRDMVAAGNSDLVAEIILGTMREHWEVGPVQAYCLRVIWDICKDDDSHKAAIMNGGAPEYIMNAMRKFTDSPAVQEKGCGAIWALGVSTSNRVVLVRAGGCETITSALKSYIATESLVRTAIGAMRTLSPELEAREHFKRFQASKLTAESMGFHRSCVSIQRDGCAFLSNCAVDIQKQIVNVVPLEELDAVVQAMKHHKQEVSVMQGSCFALKNYTHEEKNCRTLRRCKDVHDVLMDASKFQPSPACMADAGDIMERLQLSRSMDESIEDQAYMSLINMINSQAASPQATLRILDFMRNYDWSPRLISSSLQMLRRLLEENQMHHDQIYNGGILQEILKYCSKFEKSGIVCEESCVVIACLSRDERRHDALYNAGACDVIFNSLFSFKTNERLAEHALETLKQLVSTQKDCFNEIKSNIHLITDTIEANTSNELVLIYGTAIVSCLEEVNYRGPGERRSVASNVGNAAPNRNRAWMPVSSAMQQARTEMQGQLALGGASARNFGHNEGSSLRIFGKDPSYGPTQPISVAETMNELKAYLKSEMQRSTRKVNVDRVLFYLNQTHNTSLDNRLRAIAKTQLLNKLYAMLGLPKIHKSKVDVDVPVPQHGVHLLCQTIILIEDRSDSFNRVRYFGVLEIAVQSEKLSLVRLALVELTAILSRSDKTETQNLCLQVLSWTDVLVKACCNTFPSNRGIQLHFFKVIAILTIATKLEHLPTTTVDAIVQHIIDSLDSDHNKDDELLVGHVTYASVALLESVNVNQNLCELLARSFLNTLKRWLDNVDIITKILDVVITCQQNQSRLVMTEGHYRSIVKTMEKHADISDIQEQGCKVSRYIMKDDSTFQKIFGTVSFESIYTIFRRAISNYSDNERILVDSLFCLNCLIATPSYNSSIVNVSTTLSIFDELVKKLDDPRVADACLSLLVATLKFPKKVFDLESDQATKVGSYIIKLMELFPYRPGIQEKGSISICLLLQQIGQTTFDETTVDQFRKFVKEAAKTFPDTCGKYQDQLFAMFGQSPSRPSGIDGGNNFSNIDPTNDGEGNQNTSDGSDRANNGDNNDGGDGFRNNDRNENNEKKQQQHDKKDQLGGFDLHFLQASPLALWGGPGQLLPIRRIDLEDQRKKFNVIATETNIGVIYKVATAEQFWSCFTSRDVHFLHLSGHGSAPNQQSQTPPLLLLESDGWGMAHRHGPEDIFSFLHGNKDVTVKFVFVSTCHSHSVGQKLVDCGIPHVICGRKDEFRLLEAPAVEFQLAFYRALAWGNTIRQSFDEAKKRTVLSNIMGRDRLKAEVEKYCLLPEQGEHSYIPSVARWRVQSSISSTVLDKNNLKCPPTRKTRFRGREVEQCRILQYLRDDRIVRVVGGRGIGKKATARAVCEYVRMRYNLLGIDNIMWFGPSFKLQDTTLRDLFSMLREQSQPGSRTDEATQLILKHVANMKVLFIIESECHDTMKVFLSMLEDETEDHRAILIEPGKDDEKEDEKDSVPNDTLYKMVAIRELDAESSLWIFSAWKYAEIEGRHFFFDRIKAVYNGKPILRKLILSAVGGQNPRAIIEAARSTDAMNFNGLLMLCELACVFDFQWKAGSRTELEHVLGMINQEYQKAVAVDEIERSRALLWTYRQLMKLRADFHTFEDLVQSYKEKKKQRKEAKTRLMVSPEHNEQLEQELMELKKQNVELQNLADSLVAEIQARIHYTPDIPHLTREFPNLNELDGFLENAVRAAYDQCDQLLSAEVLQEDYERVEKSNIRLACLKELDMVEAQLLSFKAEAEKRLDMGSTYELNIFCERVEMVKTQTTDKLVASTAALSYFAHMLVSRINQFWAANPI